MNQFVDFINQFYSQSAASSDAAYAERSTQKLEGIKLNISKLPEDVKNGKVDVLILTGNAGDGKTFLCKEIYKDLTGKELPNREILTEDYQGKTLHIIKDASEVEETKLKKVISILEKKISSGLSEKERVGVSNQIIIIAGNEGKLSQLFQHNSELSTLLRNALRADFYDVRAETAAPKGDQRIQIVNFNWRALVADGAFESILKGFLNESKWDACKDCEKNEACPIYFNVESLRVPIVAERLKILFKFLHYHEGHFTLRELFSALAYLITAGKNCAGIKELLKDDNSDEKPVLPAEFVFYNNIFSIHAGPLQLEDKILRRIRNYDVVYARLPILNVPLRDLVDNLDTYVQSGTKSKNVNDLPGIKRLGKEDVRIFDYLKRRLYFMPLDFQGAWPDMFINPNDTNAKKIISQIRDIQAEHFLPFKGFREFDEFMSGNLGNTAAFKLKIIKGLNMMVNRHDPEVEFFLKAYKPQRYGQTYSLEIRNEAVEDVDIDIKIEYPQIGSGYIEFLPRRLALAVNMEADGDGTQAPLYFAVDIEMYELLYSILNGNQAKHGFSDILGGIDDFREAFYYRLLEQIDKPKFGLDTAQKSAGALEIAAKSSEIRIKQVS